MLKKIRVFVILALLVLGYGTENAAGVSVPEAQLSPPPPTIASTVDHQISTIEKQLVDAAEAMPASRGASDATPAQQSPQAPAARVVDLKAPDGTS